MRKSKLIIAAMAAVLLIVIIAQNTAAVETRILFVTITMPRALLLLVTLLVGFIIGLLSAGSVKLKAR